MDCGLLKNSCHLTEIFCVYEHGWFWDVVAFLHGLCCDYFSTNTKLQQGQRINCCISSANSSLVTDPSQNWLQTVNYLSQLLLWLISCLSFDLLTVYTPFRQLRSSADTQILCIPHVRSKTLGKPCPKAMEFTPFWHLSHSVLLCLQNCFKTSPLWIIPQVISNSVFLLASPPPLDSITPCYSPFVHLCVCVCACAGVVCKELAQYHDYNFYIHICTRTHTHSYTHTHTQAQQQQQQQLKQNTTGSAHTGCISSV